MQWRLVHYISQTNIYSNKTEIHLCYMYSISCTKTRIKQYLFMVLCDTLKLQSEHNCSVLREYKKKVQSFKRKNYINKSWMAKLWHNTSPLFCVYCFLRQMNCILHKLKTYSFFTILTNLTDTYNLEQNSNHVSLSHDDEEYFIKILKDFTVENNTKIMKNSF